jgi:prevent-host-death family protein
MITFELSTATAPLKEYLPKVRQGPTVLTDHGKPVAALVLLEEVDLETVSLSTNPKFLALIEDSRTRAELEGSLSGQELRRELGLE